MIQVFQQYFTERFMQPFYASLYPNTKALTDFKARGFQHCFMWASSRMVDDIEGILAQWRAEKHQGRSDLPICLMAIRRDSMPVTASFAKQVNQPVAVAFPDDAVDTLHGMRMAIMDRTVQVAFVGATHSDSDSLAVQFQLFAAGNRRFYTSHELNGESYTFPCVLETNELMPESVDSGQKNISIHKVDLLVHESIPLITDCDYAATPSG